MGRIVVSDNVTIDGVMQDPAGDEGFERGGWVGLIANRPELGQFALLEATTSEAMLMGRRTYEWFAGRWPSRTGQLAHRLNTMPKYVVSSKLEEPQWANTTVLRGDLVEEVKRLKAELEGDIVVPASVGFVRTLLANGLVDELRLRIFPVLLGAGQRLFDDTGKPQAMRLVESRTLDGDTASLRFQRIPEESPR